MSATRRSSTTPRWWRVSILREPRVRTAKKTMALTDMCKRIVEEYPRAIFFMGRLIFREEKWYYRLLHNETPNAIQRRLQFDGLQAIVLPIRVLQS